MSMLRPSYQDSIIANRWLIEAKAQELNAFIGYSEIFDDIDDTEQELFKRQLDVMWELVEIMDEHIELFGGYDASSTVDGRQVRSNYEY